jgi:lysophospholipase L1-like esterase
MKQLGYKIIAVILSILLCLICMETIVRVFDLSPPRMAQMDPVLGHRYIPGQSMVNQYGVSVQIGDHGFRGPEPVKSKKPGTYRVIFLGDSFVHALGVPYEDVFYNLINQKFTDEGQPIEVIGLGVEMYGTVDEYMLYRHVARHYRPDLIVLCFYVGNDLFNNYPPEPHRPGARLVDGRIEFQPVTLKRRNPVRDFFRKHVRIYSYLPELFKKAAALISSTVSKKTGRSSKAEIQARFEALADTEYTHLTIKEDESEIRWRITLAVLEKLQKEVKDDGGRLTLCVFPTMAQVYDRYWNILVRKFEPDWADESKRFLPQDILAGFSRSHDIDFIPLSRKMMKAARETDERFYLDGDIHFNANGHAFVARELAPAIEDIFINRSIEQKTEP